MKTCNDCGTTEDVEDVEGYHGNIVGHLCGGCWDKRHSCNQLMGPGSNGARCTLSPGHEQPHSAPVPL